MATPSSEPQEDIEETGLLDVLELAAQNWRLLVLAPLAIGLLALGISFLVPPTFTAATKFLPPQQQQSAAAAMLQSLGALSGLAGGAPGLKNPADQFIGFLKSRTVQDALVARFKLMDRYESEYLEDARKELGSNSSISSGKDGLITIEVDDKDPKFAAQLANGYVAELSVLVNRLALTESQQRRAFFEKELAETKTNLVAAEQALKGSGVNVNALKANPEAAMEELVKLKAAVTVQEVKIAGMRSYLAEAAPAFRQALTELAALRNQLARAEKEEPRPTGSTTESDYVAKFRDFKYHETLFELFAKQYEMARIDESREGSLIQVVDVAMSPEKKSKPKKAIIAVLATVLSGFALFFYLFTRRALQQAALLSPTNAAKIAAIRAALSFRRNG
jgi:uncharacterized protein involved in exopolysaccharide biosynthesis